MEEDIQVGVIQSKQPKIENVKKNKNKYKIGNFKKRSANFREP